MAIENISSGILPVELVSSIGTLVTVLQALGGFIILYLIFSIINTLINRKKNKEIKKISQDLGDIKKLLSEKKRKG